MKIKIIIVLLGALNLGLFHLSACSNLEIDSRLKSVDAVFKSVRGFGSDAFEIHKFTLVDPVKINGFKDYSNTFMTHFKFIAGSMEEDMEESQIDTLNSNIDKIVNTGDSVYRFLETDDEFKLYIYSPKLNEGYFIYLKI